MKKKILVVDDEKDMVEAIRDFLAPRGYTVMSAYNGSEALKKAKEWPDLIILDIMMPGVNGFEVLRELRNDQETKLIPVIMLTAKRDSDSLFKAGELGSTDYIMKPFDVTELLNLVNKYLKA